MKQVTNQSQEQKSRLGVESLGDLDELGKKIVDAVDVQFFRERVDSDIHEVHICGSFAAGSATETFSDLDVRVVVDPLSPELATDVERALRVDVGPEIIPDVCGYLDARLATERPGEDTPSVCIWDGDEL